MGTEIIETPALLTCTNKAFKKFRSALRPQIKHDGYKHNIE